MVTNLDVIRELDAKTLSKIFGNTALCQGCICEKYCDQAGSCELAFELWLKAKAEIDKDGKKL